MDSSSPFHRLRKFVDADDTIQEKNRINTAKLYCNNKTAFKRLFSRNYDPNPDYILTQTNNPKTKLNPKFVKIVTIVKKANHSVLNCFRRKREEEEKTKNIFSIEITCEIFQPLLKSIQESNSSK